jgi:hypothetical protein
MSTKHKVQRAKLVCNLLRRTELWQKLQRRIGLFSLLREPCGARIPTFPSGQPRVFSLVQKWINHYEHG